MAHLRIATPEGTKTDGFTAGYMASVWLDGEDISRYVTKTVVTTDAEGFISAELHVVLHGLEIDLPASLKVIMDHPVSVLAESGASAS